MRLSIFIAACILFAFASGCNGRPQYLYENVARKYERMERAYSIIGRFVEKVIDLFKAKEPPTLSDVQKYKAKWLEHMLPITLIISNNSMTIDRTTFSYRYLFQQIRHHTRADTTHICFNDTDQNQMRISETDRMGGLVVLAVAAQDLNKRVNLFECA